MILALLTLADTSTPPEASVTAGHLRGVWQLGGRVASFRDVPFARAGRFEAPRLPAAWPGIRDASAFGVGCKQGHPDSNPDVPKNQSEDCQRLNVFMPATSLKPSVLLPVLVWWHGGAFKEGSSFGPFDLYEGIHIVAAGSVVVVSCNYRIGALGALSHEGGMGGNYGFLDQRACLQWVQREIHSFGGDAGRVTVWGESAGAQSIYFHMASPGSVGLFHAAVLESSPDLSLFEAKEAYALGRASAKRLGCRNHTDAEVVACLRTADVDALLRAADEASTELFTEIGTLQLHHITASSTLTARSPPAHFEVHRPS